jgi:hypothetical protein
MRRAVLLALPLLALLGGCRALVRDAVAVEYHPGATPTTTVATCDATYTLYAPEPTPLVGYAEWDVTEGTTVGYRREPDGSVVAVAGELTTPIPECRSVWRFTPKPITRWDRFVVAARDDCKYSLGAVVSVLLLPPTILWMMCGGELP